MSSQIAALLTKAGSASDVDIVRKFLKDHPQVQVVITQWVDVTGIVRSRMTSAQAFTDLVASGRGFNESPLDMLLTVTADILPEVFGHFCDERGHIVPDVSSLRVASHDSAGIGNVAMVMGDTDLYGFNPRSNLRRLLKEADEKHEFQFLVGFELEVCFLKEDGSSLDGAGPGIAGVGNSSVTHRSVVWPILNEVVVALAEAGIQLEQIIKEYGGSQWEVCLPPLPPVESVDAYVYAREVIKNIAHKHNITATFYPTPYVGEQGTKTGQHIHVSVTKGDGDDGREDGASWNPDEVMAGILSHTPALMAVGLSQVDSYLRVGSNQLAAGGYLGWGDHHRDLPIRRIHKNHWELRFHDATSNPYAMLSGVVAAALDRKPLTIGNATKFTAAISDDERKELGLTRLLPHSLKEAIEELEADRAWAETALGKEYVQWFLTTKKAEIEKVGGMDELERRKLMVTHF